MLYQEDITGALSSLKKMESDFNRIYKHHKLDRDQAAREIKIVQNALKKVLDTDLPVAQTQLFSE